ncbi:MAG: P-loop NTPase fold protein [Rubrivivax sp.]
MRWLPRLLRKLTAEPTAPPDGPAQAAKAAVRSPHTIPADNPVRDADDDKLGRAVAAQLFAKSVLHLDASEGLVVGVLGPWGSGKTSFVNLARPAFEQDSVQLLDFNPWMFSGAEQLVQSFFAELSAQLKLRSYP